MPNANLLNAAVSSSLEAFVCSSCRRRKISGYPLKTSYNQFPRRNYAVAASAPVSQITETSTSQLTPIPTETRPKYTIRAGVLLSRPPLLTTSPTPFESSFYFYQRRLNERLALPFSQYFYFKRGTPAYEEWKSRRRERGGVAGRDVGKYNAYSKEAWHDEILVGDKENDPEALVRELVQEEGREPISTPEEANDPTKPLYGLRRTTEADRKNDTKSLERALTRTLYLLVKKPRPNRNDGSGYWQFPSGVVEGMEGLREVWSNIGFCFVDETDIL